MSKKNKVDNDFVKRKEAFEAEVKLLCQKYYIDVEAVLHADIRSIRALISFVDKKDSYQQKVEPKK